MSHECIPCESGESCADDGTIDSGPAYDEARATLVDALELAAIRLRDAELEIKAAREAYAEALQAFNRHVAPVG